MNSLETFMLKKYCRKYGLDYQETDSSLTYWENYQHLHSLVKMLCASLDTFELARMEELQEEYILNHPIEYFMSYRDPRQPKENPPESTAPPQFSLKQMKALNHGFSLKTILVESR